MAWKERNPGAHAEMCRLWRDREGYNEAHAERRRVELRGRSAFKLVEPGSDDDAYLLVVARDPCGYCGAPSTELDHIVPKVDEIDNFTAACRLCNNRKGDRSLLGWMLRQRLVAEGYDEIRRAWVHAGRI